MSSAVMLPMLPKTLQVPALVANVALNTYISSRIAYRFYVPIICNMAKVLDMSSCLVAVFIINLGNVLAELCAHTSVDNSNFAIPNILAQTIGSAITLLTLNLGLVILLSRKMNFMNMGLFYRNCISSFVCFAIMFLLHGQGRANGKYMIWLLIIYATYLVYMYKFTPRSMDHIETYLVNQIIHPGEWENRSYYYNMVRNCIANLNHIIERFLIAVFDVFTLYKRSPEVKNNRSMMALISPILNFLVFYVRTDMLLTAKTLLAALASFFLFGILLSVLIKKKRLTGINLAYSYVTTSLIIACSCKAALDSSLAIAKAYNIQTPITNIVVRGSGISLIDIITTIAASRRGMFKTAAYTCLAGPMVKVFFRMSLLIYTHFYDKAKSIQASMYPESSVGLAMVALMLLVVIINFEVRNWKLEKELGYVLCLNYAIFIGFTYIFDNY